MNRYIKSLKHFLSEQSPGFGFADAKSMMEVLYYYYCESNPVDNAVIRCQFKELDSILTKLTLRENDTVFLLTGSLCADYERKSFMDGI